ncbi:MAG: hypothetical protein NVSMB52_10890 [Chloroflexota bacterium]
MSDNRLRYKNIRDQLDLDAVYQAIGFDVIDVDRNGNERGFCILPHGLHKHGDTTGKLSIHREKMVYRCFVCGGGSILSLVMEVRDLNEDEATEWLSQFAHGDTRSDTEFVDQFIESLQDEHRRKVTLPFFNPAILNKFCDSTDWFKQRGISEAIVDKYELRYSETAVKPAPWKHNKRTGERSKLDDDYVGPAVVFPHFWQGNLVGWQHRWMEWDKEHMRVPRWLSKYTNTTDFPGSDTLFNYDHAVLDGAPVIVVESVPTTLMLESLGLTSVTTFGADISDAQLRLLRRFQQGVILAPDNDDPGKKFINTATQYLERYIPVYIVPPVDRGPGADLGDLSGDEVFKQLEHLYEPGVEFND